MEKTEIKLSMETAQLEALNYYLQKKNALLQKELGKVLEKLYEETVPQEVREYVESRQKKAAPPRPRPKPSNAPKQETEK